MKNQNKPSTSNKLENAPVEKKKRKHGRPETRVLKIDAAPEYIAKTIFAAGKLGKN